MGLTEYLNCILKDDIVHGHTNELKCFILHDEYKESIKNNKNLFNENYIINWIPSIKEVRTVEYYFSYNNNNKIMNNDNNNNSNGLIL